MLSLVCKTYGAPETLVLEECDNPIPDDDEVLVDVAAAGINFPDILVIAGQYQDKTPPPFVPGNEASGVISAIGKNVSRFAVGDAVVVTPRGGALAEKCTVNENAVTTLHDDLKFEHGAGSALA